MRLLNKGIALFFSGLLLLSYGNFEYLEEYDSSTFTNNISSKTDFFSALRKFTLDSPYYQTEQQSFRIKNLAESNLKRNLFPAILFCPLQIPKENRVIQFTSILSEVITPGIIIRKIVFPTHYFL